LLPETAAPFTPRCRPASSTARHTSAVILSE
jgi:hypothetical protein